jgi:hypothetical protein
MSPAFHFKEGTTPKRQPASDVNQENTNLKIQMYKSPREGAFDVRQLPLSF